MKRREIFTFGFQAVLGLSISMLSLLPRNSEAGEYFGHSASKESRTSRQKPHQYFVPSTIPGLQRGECSKYLEMLSREIGLPTLLLGLADIVFLLLGPVRTARASDVGSGVRLLTSK